MIDRHRITFIIVIYGILFLHRAAHGAIMLDRVVAVVNHEVITWSELYKNMESDASDQVMSLPDDERNRVFRSNESAYLERLIDMRLQVQDAKRIGLQVREDEVKQAIVNIKKKYQMSDAAFEESLRKEGMSFDEYKRKLSDQILLSQVVNHQIRSKVVVTDEQVRQHIQRQKGASPGEEEFRLRQIFFKKPKDDAERKKLEEKADMIIQRLKAGEEFSALAWEYSEDPSGKIGSDLGYLKKSEMAREFTDVLSAMKTGDFSKPFWTDRGLHIIKLEERMSAITGEERNETVRAQLEEEAFAEKYRSYIKGLRENARIEIRL